MEYLRAPSVFKTAGKLNADNCSMTQKDSPYCCALHMLYKSLYKSTFELYLLFLYYDKGTLVGKMGLLNTTQLTVN